jgi:hypothetical protein
MKVKCINISGGDAADYLSIGQVYEVAGERGSGDYLLVGVLPSFRKDRFVVVEGEIPTATPQACVRQEKPCQTCGKNNDVGVNVCWCCGNQPHT